jgi:hypothetical protein
MRVLIIVILSIFNLSFFVSAQDSTWQFSIDAGLKMSLSTFSNNWSTNTAGTFVWLSDLDASVQRQFGKWLNNEEVFNITFGQTTIQDKNTKKWSSLEKSADEIDFQSISKLSLNKNMIPCFTIQVNTQVSDEDEENNFRYLNPVELTESFGLTRAFGAKNKVWCNIRFSGALRQKYSRHNSIIDDSTGAVTYFSSLTKDGGAELFMDFRWKKGDAFTFSSKATIFEALIRSNPEIPLVNNFWKYPDIRWETQFSTNVTSFLQFTYYFLLHYDREIEQKIQLKQTIGVGLMFSFSNN